MRLLLSVQTAHCLASPCARTQAVVLGLRIVVMDSAIAMTVQTNPILGQTALFVHRTTLCHAQVSLATVHKSVTEILIVPTNGMNYSPHVRLMMFLVVKRQVSISARTAPDVLEQESFVTI